MKNTPVNLMERIRFIVAEKSYLIRKGIVSIINRIEKASVICELEDIRLINSEISKHNPHFIVISISLFEESEKFLNSNVKFNISGKGIAISSLHDIEKTLDSKFKEIIYVSDKKEVIFSKLNNIIRESTLSDSKIITNELSKREKSILKMVAKGHTTKEIAEKFFLSAHTVITHRKNITAKLGIKTISGLTVYAILNNIIRIEDIN